MAAPALPDEPGAPTGGEGAAPSAAVRSGFALALGLLAAILFVSARTEAPTDHERIGERVELAQLIRAEQARAEELKGRVEELSSRVERYEQSGPSEEETSSLHAQIEGVAVPAAMTAVRGPGLVVSLNDSSLEPSRDDDPNDLVIHEQDLHAVINALWAGGAEALSVNGERVLATSAVRCVGSVLLLHGRTYSPPYVLRAVGDQESLTTALDRDHAVQQFAAAARRYQLGFDIRSDDALLLPAYAGTASLQFARPADGA